MNIGAIQIGKREWRSTGTNRAKKKKKKKKERCTYQGFDEEFAILVIQYFRVRSSLLSWKGEGVEDAFVKDPILLRSRNLEKMT